MERPYIICHMETSLDGKIMGKYLWLPGPEGVEDSFYAVQRKFNFQAIIMGRTTIDDNRTLYKKPEIYENAVPLPEGDFLTGAKGPFLIAVDGKGKLAWEEKRAEENGISMDIVEILTESASMGYKDFLRRKGISYLICGKDKVDLPLACRKIKNLLHVDTMILDKTGTITIGNRKATGFYPVDGFGAREFVRLCVLSSVSDPTAAAIPRPFSWQRKAFPKTSPSVSRPFLLKSWLTALCGFAGRWGKSQTMILTGTPISGQCRK